MRRQGWWRYRPHLTYCDGLILVGLIPRDCVGQCRTRMYVEVACELGAQGQHRSALSALRAARRHELGRCSNLNDAPVRVE